MEDAAESPLLKHADRISGRSQGHKRISRAGNCLTFPANQLIIRIL